MAALLSILLFVQAPDTTLSLGDQIEISLVRIQAGDFVRSLPGRDQQTIEITDGFWMGAYEVSWAEWRAVMDWDDGRNQPGHPARRMTWFQIQEYLDRMSTMIEGWSFRLPTEAEWEYAARSGGDGLWGASEDSIQVNLYAWTRENSGGSIQRRGLLKANDWGLYDMQGNVWEWVSDWMAPLPETSRLTNPRGPEYGTEKVRRGGSAVYGLSATRMNHRYQQPPDGGNGNIGFRIVAVEDKASFE